MEHHESNRALADVEAFAVVEAFLDGEGVDPDALKRGLANPAVRDHFVEVLIIRGAAARPEAGQNDMSVAVPHAPSLTAVEKSGRGFGARWLIAAAAMMLVNLTVGYAAGQRLVAPAAAPSVTVEAILATEAAPRAPTPTRSIAFTPGVNWTSSSGGQ